MSGDIATLSLAVDSSQVTKATAALSQFAPAAKGAQSAATPLAAAANVAAAAHANMSTQAMAAMHSIRGMTEQFAMGIPITQVLGSHLNQIAYAATGPKGLSGAFKEAGGALLGLLSPTALVVGGIAAVAGAAYLMNSAWKTSALQFDNTSRAIGVTIGELRALESAASVKGISSDDFLKGAEKFAGTIYDAKAGMGQLASLLRANGQQAGGFADTLGRVADLVRNARDDQQRLQILQQAGLPATMQWVRLMAQGADGVKAALANHKDLTAEEQRLVDQARKFDEEWNKTWDNWANKGRAAFLKIKGGFNELGDAFNQITTPLDQTGQFDNARPHITINKAAYGGKDEAAKQWPRGGPATVDPNITAHSLAMEGQMVAVLGITPIKSEVQNDGANDCAEEGLDSRGYGRRDVPRRRDCRLRVEGMPGAALAGANLGGRKRGHVADVRLAPRSGVSELRRAS